MLKSIKEDLYRWVGDDTSKSFFKCYIAFPGFRYMVWFRLGKHYKDNKIAFFIIRLVHRRLSYKFGIQIPLPTNIGRGLLMTHYGTIVINIHAVIGDNVNISHGVTIGQSNRGDKRGVPVIGNEVYIGPGAKVFGKITIGNNVAIGANAVVTKDLPSNSIAVGVPARIIPNKGSEGYIYRKV